MLPDQTAPWSSLIWAHTVCNLGYLRMRLAPVLKHFFYLMSLFETSDKKKLEFDDKEEISL